MTRHAAILALLALSLAACSPQKTEAPPADAAAPDEVRTPAVAPVASAPVTAAPNDGAVPGGPTVGGDGSRIQLSGLSLADRQANRLEGELGCSFQAGAGDPLLTAMGFAASKDAAQGLVKVGDYVERVAAPGGFDGMVNGAAFVGQGKTVTVAISGPAAGGGESPAFPATLTYDRADGAKRVFAGTWTCGP